MAPLALYRTYRPGTLAEVIGQDHVTEPLARALTSGRIHHAYLFSGPRGCGKTSTARILARSLNCESGPTPTPCGQCQSCVDLAPNGPGSIDVVELDAATHRGIDDAKELRERAIYAPAYSQYRIYILDEAHQLTSEAANALLKLIEEPPAHLRFIFATTEPDRIIPTIRSRTFHYGFRLVPAKVLVAHMADLCQREGVPADPAALAAIARVGGGSVRDSLSLLGQLLAGAGPQGLTKLDAVTALGLTDGALINEFVAALASGQAAEMFGIVDRVVTAGHDPRRFAGDLLDRVRDLIVLRAVPDAVSQGLVDTVPGDVEALVSQSESLGQAQLSQVADLLSSGISELKGATAPRLQLELLCARLALPSTNADIAGVTARVEVLERQWAQRGLATSDSPPAGDPARPDRRTVARDTGVAAAPSAGVGAEAQRAGRSPATTPAMPAQPVPAQPVPTQPLPTQPVLRSGIRPGGAGGEAPATRTAPTGPVPPSPARGSTDRRSTGAQDAVAPISADPGGAVRPPPAGQGGLTAAPTPLAGGDLARIRSLWPAVLERLAASSRVAWTLFHEAVPLSVDAGVLCLAVPQPGNVLAITTKGHDERVRQILIDVAGVDLHVSVVHDPGISGPGAARAGAVPAAPSGPTPGGAPATSVAASSGQPSTALNVADPVILVPPASSESPGTDAPGDPRRRGTRGAETVRNARRGGQIEASDDASPDDPDLPSGGSQGLALITRELGARAIGEIDHS